MRLEYRSRQKYVSKATTTAPADDCNISAFTQSPAKKDLGSSAADEIVCLFGSLHQDVPRVGVGSSVFTHTNASTATTAPTPAPASRSINHAHHKELHRHAATGIIITKHIKPADGRMCASRFSQHVPTLSIPESLSSDKKKATFEENSTVQTPMLGLRRSSVKR